MRSRANGLYATPISSSFFEIKPKQSSLIVHAAFLVVFDVLKGKASTLVDHCFAIIETFSMGQVAVELLYENSRPAIGDLPVEALIDWLKIGLVASKDEEI